MLFGKTTPGGPKNTVLDGGLDLPQRGGGGIGKIGPLWTHYISQDWLKLET